MKFQKNRYYPDNISVSYDKYFMMRAEKGLSESDVAKMAGITASMLSRWRRGLSTPSLKTLHKIATVFECKVSDFFEELPEVI